MDIRTLKPFFFLSILALLTSFSVNAQRFAPFGELSAEEILMKECSFDPDATAVVLLHEANSDYDDSYHLITRHHIRIKILKEKGISNADVSIPFYRRDGFEDIVVTRATTINVDEYGRPELLNVGQKSVFTKKINERLGEVAFTFPSVRVGSILEYEYQSNKKHYGGLEDWYFQEERPVVISKYNLVIVPNTEFAYSLVKKPEYNAVVTPDKSTGGIYFEMKNIPGLGNEPYMDSRKDYLQKVFFQLSSYGRGDGFGSKYMNSWEEVSRDLLMDRGFGNIIGKNIPGTDDFIKVVKLKTSEEQRMRDVYNYVRNNISWNGGYTKYASEGLKGAWQKKSGNSAEMNFILINLLMEAGLDVSPALISERWHGRVDTQYPFIDQFSSVIAAVNINGATYYLDARNKYTPAQLIPSNILNTTGFIVKKKTGGLVNIVNDDLRYSETIFNQLNIDSVGDVDGSVSVESEEYARVKKLEQYTEDKSGYLDAQFKKAMLQFEIKKFEVLNIENDTLPFKQNCTYTSKLSATGDYLLVPLNLFSGFVKNPMSESKRFSNVNFGYKRLISIVTNISVPKGVDLDALPKPIKLVSEQGDIVMTRNTSYDKEDNYISVLIRIEFKKSLYTANEYPALQAFYNKMFEYLDEPVLLKKK